MPSNEAAMKWMFRRNPIKISVALNQIKHSKRLLWLCVEPWPFLLWQNVSVVLLCFVLLWLCQKFLETHNKWLLQDCFTITGTIEWYVSSGVFDLRLNKRLSKQLWGWGFETPSRPLWRHCNETDKHRSTTKHKITNHIQIAKTIGSSITYFRDGSMSNRCRSEWLCHFVS